MTITIFKRKFSIAFFIMLFCLFCFTAGQYIPVYFTNSDQRLWFYIVLLLLLLGSTAVSLAKYIKGQGKVNYWWAITWSILLTTLITLVFGVLTLSLLMGTWTDVTTIYVQKNNPDVKIVSRYWNEGAFGGGTSRDDYFIVVRRPVTPLFILETSVDTNKINKTEWVKLIK
jgi:hypothetical protein